jgi:hypothetical protein
VIIIEVVENWTTKDFMKPFEFGRPIILQLSNSIRAEVFIKQGETNHFKKLEEKEISSIIHQRRMTKLRDELMETKVGNRCESDDELYIDTAWDLLHFDCLHQLLHHDSPFPR